MDTYTLKVNDENIRKTFEEDALGRNEYVLGLVKWINSIENNAILSLEGDWGSGKTFLLKQLELIYENKEIISKWKNKSNNINLSDFNFEDAKVLYYDAWENDGAENPLLNLVYNLTISAKIEINTKNIKPDTEKVLKYAWDKIKHINPVLEVIDFIKEFIIFEETDEHKLISGILQENSIKNNIKLFIDRIKDKYTDKKIVIIIDELDRCRPEFALKIIESVKHYFDEKGIIVLLSINPKEMQSIIKKYYGDDIDASIYLDKIIDVHLKVPNFNIDDYLKHIFGHDTTNAIMPNAIKTVIVKYSFSLRQINRYIGTLNSFISNDYLSGISSRVREANLEYIVAFMNAYLVPYLIGIRIVNVKLFEKIVKGEAENEFVEDYFSNEENWKVNHLYSAKNKGTNLTEDVIKEIELQEIKLFYNKAFIDKHYKSSDEQLIVDFSKKVINTCNLLGMTDVCRY